MFPEPTELRLIGCSIQLIWTQIKYIDTKNQVADFLNKGNFTRDEWNHLLCLFNISHFSSTVCSAAMAKRSQQDSGEEWVTTKSRPMMNLIARAPSHGSSSTSVSPEKRSYGSQDPWSSIAKKEERSGRPDIGIDRLKTSDHCYHEQFMETFSSASYLKWDDDRDWSFQDWKTYIEHTSDRDMASTIRHWKRWSRNGIVSRIKIIRELGEWSGSKKTEKDFECYWKWRKTFYDSGMFMAVTMESAVFMWKNYLNICQPIANTTDLTLKQMFDISTRLVSEQNEISGLETIGWENHSWKYLSLIGDERVINLHRTKVYVFSDSVLCLGKILENPQSNDAWEDRLGWLKSSQNYRNFERIDGEPMEFEWNIFPKYNTLQLNEEAKSLLLRLDETPENFTGRILFTSMFNDIFCGSAKKNACRMPASFLCVQRDLEKDNRHSLVLVPKRSGTASVETVHKEYGTKLQKGCCFYAMIANVHFSVLRLHCPEVNSKAKDMVICRYTMQPIWKWLRLFFA